ncbi:MAG: hypothetical protein ABSH39_07180 [Candidatus Acidiferrum sp.]|jgi:hypothetical protein
MTALHTTRNQKFRTKSGNARGQSAVELRTARWVVVFQAVLIFLLASPLVRAQGVTEEAPGKDSGNYNIQQSIEAGYRSTYINGNINTYDTFINLGSGFRLFDYTLDMRSKDHNGLFFDNLSFSNFGYGGDPNDVTRLRIEKNKFYDFRVLFRRDKNFWDYNLLANPLNPAVSNPSIAITTSPHALDLVRRMQDYNLTLMPQSRVRVRLGYSRNRDEGPGFFTTDGGTISQFNETYSYTTNSYRAGVDFRVLPRTTISYDQFLTYFKQDNVITDNPQNSGLQLADGTPVDLGIIWSTVGPVEILPCAAPIVTAPNIVNPACNGYLSYSQAGNPRNFMPTERLSFESNYFKNLETAGSIGYSTANNSVPDFNEIVNDFTSRTGSRGSTASGPADTKRVSVNADWSGVYSLTEKLRIVDQFRYDNWRTPGLWDSSETNIFGQMQPGLAGLAQPQAIFNSATFLAQCPAPYTAVTCPAHAANSAADAINGPTSTFLGQNLKSNTIELQYDFTNRFTARIGSVYTDRTIADFSATFISGETYFPGGAGGTPANDFLAARGACAVPTVCTPTVDPATGDLISLTFSGPAAGNDTARNLTGIHEQTALVGFTARPIDALRITGDFQFGSNDYSFTRISPRQVQSYKVHASYKPRAWINFDGALDIHENRDNVATVNDVEHGRSYSFVTTFMPGSKLFFDLGYTYTDIYNAAQICYYANANGPAPVTQCPASLGYAPAANSGLGAYSSKQHFAHGGVLWKPVKRVTLGLGYAGTFVGGSTLGIDALQVPGTLAFNYQKPYVRIILDVYKGLSYRMTWNYYGYNGRGQPSNAIADLAPIPIQDFNGSTAEFALRYTF